jgi:hypothetical protein
MLSEGGEIKAARIEVASLPQFARPVANRIARIVLSAHVTSVYMAGAKVSMLFVSALDADAPIVTAGATAMDRT